MAENEEVYLRQCLEQNTCPACQQPITEKFGSGQVKDGVFCSLDCYAKWHQAMLKQRHEDRVKKDRSDE
jgi:hypothetical protein